MRKNLRAAYYLIKNEGFLPLAIRVLEKLNNRARKHEGGKKQQIQTLVKYEDARDVDFSILPDYIKTPKATKSNSFKTAWIMSPPGESSGGHQNLFRFIDYLERSGHTAKIYLYSANSIEPDVKAVRQMLEHSTSYPKLNAEIIPYSRSIGVTDDTDAIFATGWETAYPAYLDRSTAHRFYFVQDFEPYFYATGSESILAENTYKFGFYGITAGGWLAKKLNSEYGMRTEHFDFGADRNIYKITNTAPRNEIFFYARPVTARRGFELGIMALDIFAKKMPEYTINLAGWDVSDYNIPFRYNNLSNLRVSELNDIYNRCSVALVISLTNMSLLPLELIASGVIPVVNEGLNNRLVSNNKFIEYCQPTPQALADRLIEVARRKDLSQYAHEAAASVSGADWDTSGAKFVDIFEKEMKRG
jgi:glycosyltransferase involved in cell wall biosynthesis